jgi:hypothetical protein
MSLVTRDVLLAGRLSGGHAISRGAKVFGVEGTSPQSPLSGNRLSRYSSFTEPWSSGSSREGRSLVKHLSSLGGSRLSRASAPEVSFKSDILDLESQRGPWTELPIGAAGEGLQKSV